MPDIRIRVGVALDANLKTVYRPIVEAAQQASDQVSRALNTGHRIAAQGARKATAETTRVVKTEAAAQRKAVDQGEREKERAYERTARTARRWLREGAKEYDAAQREQARAAERAEREKERAFERTAREARRWVREQVREIERAEAEKVRLVQRAEEKAQRERDKYARRTGYWAMRNFSAPTPTLQMGTRVARDIARGAGVDFSTGHLVNSFVHRQDLATKISSGAWIGAWGHPETAVNGSQNYVDPKTLMREANQVALETATEGGSESILEGIREFVSKTGDLRTARDLVKEIAIYAKATGTNMSEALDASAEIANALPASLSQAERVAAVKASIAALGGQGEVGAIEIRHLVKGGGMAKLAGVSNMFTLGEDTQRTASHAGLNDKVSQNIAMMGALAQMAKVRGARGSPTLATNSAMAFITDMTNKTTQKRWGEAFGTGAVFTDKTHTQIRDPKALILAALDKTHGAGDKITHLMSNKNSRAVLTSSAQFYAEGVAEARTKNPKVSDKDAHAAGLKKVSDKIDSYLKVTINNEQVDAKFKLAMETATSKVAIFNQKMQMAGDRMADRLLPALEKLAPHAEKAAGALGDFVVWATDHPGKAVATALSASITKAGIENVVRLGIENSLKRAAVSTFAGGLGQLLAGAAIVMTIHQVGKLIIDNVLDNESKETTENAVASMGAEGHATTVLSRKAYTEEDKKKLEEELADLQKKRNKPVGSDLLSRFVRSQFTNAWGEYTFITPEFVKDKDRAQAEALRQNAEAIAKVEKAIAEIKNGTLKVVVQNQPPRPDGGSMPIPAHVGPEHD